LLDEQGSDVRAMELRVGDRGAEEEFAASGEVAEVGNVGGAQRGRQKGGCEGGEGELDEVAAVHEWSVGDEF
jgi:hypothetical protein